jgi:hypothetical protein
MTMVVAAAMKVVVAGNIMVMEAVRINLSRMPIIMGCVVPAVMAAVMSGIIPAIVIAMAAVIATADINMDATSV